MSDTSFQMTRELAEEIRALRCGGTKGNGRICTWRKIAEVFADRHPDLPVTRGHQIEGMELCREAGKVLGEDGINW